MNSDVTPLMTGILFGESTRWHDGRVWFSDWIDERLYAVDEATGVAEIIAEVHSMPFCFDWRPDGTLLVVNARDNVLMRQVPGGTFATVADLSTLSQYGCNEIVCDARGNAYVNNVNFEFPGGEFRPGFIALVTPDGVARKVADGIAFANGMAITPDGKTLICAESFAKSLTAFDISADGSLSNRRIWALLENGADGISMDSSGAIWAASGHSCVRVREHGEVLETIALDDFCFSCVLGGADGRTLFMNVGDWTGGLPKKGERGSHRLLGTRVAVPA